MARDFPSQVRPVFPARVDAKGVRYSDCSMGDRSLEGAGSENGVELWLEALNIEADHEGTRQKMTTTTPSTPRTKPLCLQRNVPQLFEEISPTDTNFSSDIVFDSPLSPSCNATLNPRWDTDTEASSLDDEDEARVRKELFCSLEKLDSNDVKPTIQSRASAQDLTTPLKHPLHGSAYPELTSDVDSLPRLVLDFDPEANHLICLSSCLQCVLSDLRCSRTLPSCSRCIRNGHGELCLAQRKRLHVEVFDEDGSVDTDPILLKVEGDDNDTYDKKFKLQDDLLKVWSKQQERNNWVMPANDGITGDWKTTVLRRAIVHPGEGKGPLAYRRMRIAEWHENAKRGRV